MDYNGIIPHVIYISYIYYIYICAHYRRAYHLVQPGILSQLWKDWLIGPPKIMACFIIPNQYE